MADSMTASVVPIALKLGLVLVTILVIFILLLVFGFVAWTIKRKRAYNRDVLIIRMKQNGQYAIEFDKGGYIKTKNKDWKYRLLKNKSWLNGKYQHDIPKEKGGNINFLYRDTADNYYHIDLLLEDIFKKEIAFQRDSNGNFIKDKDGKNIPEYEKDDKGNFVFDDKGEKKPLYLYIPKLKLRVTEEDVEWAKTDFDDYVVAYAKKNWLMQMLPVFGMALFVVLVIVVLYLLLQKFDILHQVAVELTRVSENIIQLKQSSVAANAPI
jgi:hypothetical protein